MQYHSHTLPEFWKYYGRLDESTRQQAREAFKLFRENPDHPGLNFERMRANRDLCTARVNRSVRAGGVIRGDTVTWFFIGAHAEWDAMITRVKT